MNHELWSRGVASEVDEQWERTNIVCCGHMIKKKIALKCKDNHVLKNIEKVKFYKL